MFKYAPDNQWFIRTMNVVFEVGGDLVRKEVAHNLMRLIAEGEVTVSHDLSAYTVTFRSINFVDFVLQKLILKRPMP